MKSEILYGMHPVFEALKARRRKFFEVTVATGKRSNRVEEIKRYAESLKISVKESPPVRIHSTTGADRHQNIIARVSSYPSVRLADILNQPESTGSASFLLLLDNIVDPNNLGALIRTAVAVGIEGVVITRHRSASPTPVVSKASAGALEHVRLAIVANITDTIKLLKKKRFWIAGMDGHCNDAIYDSDLSGAIAIVIGGEEKGLRPLVKKHCDMLLSIPQKKTINSLNASAAGAIAMYEVFRQRTVLLKSVNPKRLCPD
ncbi:23S rRNA (guanosine(2251)-2'-O)-methyltransferase RlmB [Thermodesulfobacteriota bacterium]